MIITAPGKPGGRRRTSFFNPQLAKGMSIRYHSLALILITTFVACGEPIKHDENIAAKRAVEFAQVAFVRQDVQRSYAMLADGARRHIPIEKFGETLSRMHPTNHPRTVRATEYEPMPGEKAIYIYLIGDNAGEQFGYTLTMEGTAATDYKVLKLTSGTRSYFPSTTERKPLNNPLSGLP